MTDRPQASIRRRERILVEARKIMAAGGYDGLTMRGLAEASGVSVPTLYHLIGGKDAILAAEFASTFESITGALDGLPVAGTLDVRQELVIARGIEVIAASPDYYRQLARALWSAGPSHALRTSLARAYVALTEREIHLAVQRGELARWIRAEAIAHTLFGQVESGLVAWSHGDHGLHALGARVRFGVATCVWPAVRPAHRNRWLGVLRAAHDQLPPLPEMRDQHE